MSVVGRVLLIPRGSWTSTDVYNRLDWVRYNGVAWVCKQDNTTGVVPSTSASEWQILAQDGTVGGWSSISSKPFSTIGSGLMVNASDELMVAKNLVTDKTTVQALNELLTGTGTAGYDAGAGVSPRYFPAKYIYNTMLTVADGDMVTIKIPVAGSEYGVYVSLDNGSTYHPVALRETTKFSTEYGVGAYITLIYDALGAVSDIYPVSGGDTPGTVTGGAFKVLNFALSSSSYDVDDPAETDIADNDYFPFYDTSATAKKKSLWSNVKDKLAIQWVEGSVSNADSVVLPNSGTDPRVTSTTKIVCLLGDNGTSDPVKYSTIVNNGDGTISVTFPSATTANLAVGISNS